jgi:hypothetical protein
MFPDENRTYPGRKFIQALQVCLVIAIAGFTLAALTRPQTTPDEDEFTPPVAVVVPTVDVYVPDVYVPTAAPASNAEALYEEAWVAQDEGNHAEAIDLYTQVLELDSTMANAWLGRAVAYAQLGDNDRLSRNDFWHYVQNMETERIERDITLNQSFELEMSEGRVYAITFKAKSGDQLDLAVSSVTSGEAGDVDVVDPLILLFDPNNTLLEADDDMLRTDGSVINMNSHISDYDVTRAGTYTLLVTHAGAGSYGSVRVSVNSR